MKKAVKRAAMPAAAKGTGAKGSVPKVSSAKKKAGSAKSVAMRRRAVAETAGAEAALVPVEPTESGAAVMDRLHAVVLERRTANPAHSHSARLLSRGTAKVAQKFGEEAVECLIEAVGGDAASLVSESADVLYHLLVMWVSCGVAPEQVWAELARREGVSGVVEKASRVRVSYGTSKIP